MIGRLLPAVAALLVFCSICGPTAMAQEHPAHEWGYSGSEGPAHWGELTPEFAACKTGRRQSPVNIVGARSADLPAIQFEYKPARSTSSIMGIRSKSTTLPAVSSQSEESFTSENSSLSTISERN